MPSDAADTEINSVKKFYHKKNVSYCQSNTYMSKWSNQTESIIFNDHTFPSSFSTLFYIEYSRFYLVSSLRNCLLSVDLLLWMKSFNSPQTVLVIYRPDTSIKERAYHTVTPATDQCLRRN